MVKPLILVVDDESTNIEVISSILQQEYDIRTAFNGEQALKALHKFSPDLILMDNQMPVKNGLDTLEDLNRNEATRDIPVIMITGQNDEKTIETAFARGAGDFITKPFKTRELKARIQTHIKLKQSMGNLKQINISLEHLVEEKAREALRTAHLLKDVINSFPESITLLDREFRYRMVNQSFLDTLGVVPISIQGKTAVEAGLNTQEFFDEKKRGLFERVLQGEKIQIQTWYGIREENRLFEIQMLPFAPQGEIDGILTISRDITEDFKQKQESFRTRKKAAMGELISIIAHQLKQPLNTIRLNVEAIREEFEFGGEISSIQSYESALKDQVRFMSESIDELRNLFHPNKKTKEFTVSSSIRKTLAIIGMDIQNKGIRLFTELDGDRVIRGVENEFQQVIINIMNNASEVLQQKLPNDPYIKIHTYFYDRRFYLEIEDNGGGIPLDIIEKVFDPYFTTKGEAGTGIGLNLARMIVQESFSSKINVRNSDSGAVFSIEFGEGI